MAHWSSGYADFHEELYAQPPRPPTPLALPCAECDETFTTLKALREHVFVSHPVAHPVLLRRGRPCGDMRELIHSRTDPIDWTSTNCTRVQVNGVEVDPDELGRQLSTGHGIVQVRLDNDRTYRDYEFDFAIADEADLRGVDKELARFIEDGDISSGSISTFYERALEFGTARSYASGITEYLYWLAGRGQILDATAEVRNRDKLNNAATVLRDIQRPAALAITGLISFHFNHFDETTHRALSPHLGAVSGRLGRMLVARTDAADLAAIPGELAHLERLLADERTLDLIALCSLPLGVQTSAEVAAFDLSTVNEYDRVKAALFVAEHHLATGDPRAVPLLRAGSKNGLPDHWVNARLDCITDEGPPWNTAPAKTTPVRGRARTTQRRAAPKPAKPSRGATATATSAPNRSAPNATTPTVAPSTPETSKERRIPADVASADTPTMAPRPGRTSSATTRNRTETAPAVAPVPTPATKTGANDRTTGASRSLPPRPAPPVFLEPTVPLTKDPEPAISGLDSADAGTTDVADSPPWETSVSTPIFSSPTHAPRPQESQPSASPLLDRLLPWRKPKSR